MNNTFGVGEGPVFLHDVNCDDSHLKLSQCVHPLSIGLRECPDSPRAGVICPELASPSITTTSPSISYTLQTIQPSTTTTSVNKITPSSPYYSQTTNFNIVPTSDTNISPTTTLVLMTVSAHSLL